MQPFFVYSLQEWVEKVLHFVKKNKPELPSSFLGYVFISNTNEQYNTLTVFQK